MKSRTKVIISSVMIGLCSLGLLEAVAVRMPGKQSELNHFVTYNYGVSGEDLLFHLNEILLFEEMPTYLQIEEYVARGIKKDYLKARMRKYVIRELRRSRRMTFTHRIREIFNQDRMIRNYIISKAGSVDREMTFDLNTRNGQLGASELLLHLGLKLIMDHNGKFRVLEYYTDNFRVNQYYKLQGYHEWRLDREINKSRRFTFKLNECELDIPFEFNFLTAATGLILTRNNFAHMLVNDRRLQMFTGILYRLSPVEIEFISSLAPNHAIWKKIFSDDHLLSGMFLLSHALRVKNNRFRLPGGEKSTAFWQQLTGAHPFENPSEFLQTLAAKDNGKLNYFYVMGFFLPGEIQNQLFAGYDTAGFNDIYHLVRLKKREKVTKGLNIPQLDDSSFFSMLFAFQVRDGNIYFPGGISCWADALGVKDISFRGILKHLLSARKKKSAIHRFTSIYTKFIDRPELLTPAVLDAMFQRFDDYNVILDYIEMLPLKRPETVIKLLNWAASFESVPGVDPMNQRNLSLERLKERLIGNQGKRSLSVAVFQSLLAILARGAQTLPGRYDYDRLMEALTAIPIQVEGQTYDGIIQFLDKQCGLDVDRLEAGHSMTRFLLNGIHNPVIRLHDESYTLDARSVMTSELKKVMEKQQTCSLASLARISELLDIFASGRPAGPGLLRALRKACQALPLIHAEETHLTNLVERLIDQNQKKSHPSKILSTVRTIKDEVLLGQLKHFLVTAVYALATGSSNLRIFYNPNFSKLHDFTYHHGITPWNTCSKSLGDLREILYHVEGGLSRVHIVLAEPFGEQLFRLKMEEYSNQTAPIIYNNLNLFPLTRLTQGHAFLGQLVQRGADALQMVEQQPGAGEETKDRFAAITAGYPYRKIMEKLNGKLPTYYPTFKLLKRFGEHQLMAQDASALENIPPDTHQLGPVLFKTFGRLKPYCFSMFPQALSQLFTSGIIGGEMNNEFKIKAAYVSWKRSNPPQLLGFLAYRYLAYASLYYSQKYENDFYKTYYMYDIYNHLYLDRIIKTLKHIGVLKIK